MAANEDGCTAQRLISAGGTLRFSGQLAPFFGASARVRVGF